MTYQQRQVETSLPIEIGVEMPERSPGDASGFRGKKKHSWPFKFMHVGDSVLDPGGHPATSKAYRAAKAHQRNTDGEAEFAARQMPATDTHPAGLRIWRTK